MEVSIRKLPLATTNLVLKSIKSLHMFQDLIKSQNQSIFNHLIYYFFSKQNYKCLAGLMYIFFTMNTSNVNYLKIFVNKVVIVIKSSNSSSMRLPVYRWFILVGGKPAIIMIVFWFLGSWKLLSKLSAFPGIRKGLNILEIKCMTLLKV